METMDIKKYIAALGFVPKNGTNGICHKIYGDYAIEIDFEKQGINYGNSIVAESRTTQNFSQPENFVVLECVDRLLIKGYKPQNIILEKTWPSGHGTSGRLDTKVSHPLKRCLFSFAFACRPPYPLSFNTCLIEVMQTVHMLHPIFPTPQPLQGF